MALSVENLVETRPVGEQERIFHYLHMLGGLVASLPLVSVLGMMWLWRDTHDPERMAAHATGTFWFVIPSLPMFLLIPAMLKRGTGFWPALAAGCVLTMALYALMVWLGPKLGLRL